MKLRRRYIRNIRQNLSFYIASTVLTMAALFLFFLFHIAGNAILTLQMNFLKNRSWRMLILRLISRFRNRMLKRWKKSMGLL